MNIIFSKVPLGAKLHNAYCVPTGSCYSKWVFHWTAEDFTPIVLCEYVVVGHKPLLDNPGDYSMFVRCGL